jgi:hypothetical protein
MWEVLLFPASRLLKVQIQDADGSASDALLSLGVGVIWFIAGIVFVAVSLAWLPLGLILKILALPLRLCGVLSGDALWSIFGGPGYLFFALGSGLAGLAGPM